jgi:glycosyltransferase involved in cell wall biosynthesis
MGIAVDPIPRLCVLMPALNEADALPAALAGLPWDVRVVVVDNGSTDGTGQVARQLGVEVVTEPRRGFGSACWRGLQAAGGADVVVYMDADATLDWCDLGTVAGPVLRGEADLVLGARARDRREPGAMPWHVALANTVLARLCGWLAGVRITDVSPFRAVRRDALLGLGMRDRTYGWPLEMVLRAGRAGLRVTEVPVAYRRRAGVSKVTGRPWPTAKAVAKMSWVLARHTAAVRARPRL